MYAGAMSAQGKGLPPSKRSFMQWPIEWLVAVIVAMALLIFVGLVMSESSLRFNDSTRGPPTTRADASNASNDNLLSRQ
jgi:hypothetical protein